MMKFIELRISCKMEFREILIAEINSLDAEGIVEFEDGFLAYFTNDKFDIAGLMPLIDKYGKAAELKWETVEVENKNWNEEWEKSFDPVVIENKCVIRASFHEPFPEVPIEIVIDPKMSFGTGHHETTYLMIKQQLNIVHEGKSVLDCGCGTGILSILASKLNARYIKGIDNDERAVANSIENIKLNGITNVEIKHGTINDTDPDSKFDILLANISKNILLSEIPAYSWVLNKGGKLVLSGFYVADLEEISKKTKVNALELIGSEERNEWSANVFIKK